MTLTKTNKMITKKDAKIFVEKARQMLIDLGAVEQKEDIFSKDSYYKFKLQTRLGELEITLRNNQTELYMIFSVYLDNEAVEKAKEELGHWKYNCMYNCEHNTPERAVEFAKNHFEDVL